MDDGCRFTFPPVLYRRGLNRDPYILWDTHTHAYSHTYLMEKKKEYVLHVSVMHHSHNCIALWRHKNFFNSIWIPMKKTICNLNIIILKIQCVLLRRSLAQLQWNYEFFKKASEANKPLVQTSLFDTKNNTGPNYFSGPLKPFHYPQSVLLNAIVHILTWNRVTAGFMLHRYHILPFWKFTPADKNETFLLG